MQELRKLLICGSLVGLFLFSVSNGWIRRPEWMMLLIIVCVVILSLPLADLVTVLVGILGALVMVRTYGVESIGTLAIIVAAFYVMLRPLLRRLFPRRPREQDSGRRFPL